MTIKQSKRMISGLRKSELARVAYTMTASHRVRRVQVKRTLYQS